MTTKIRNWFGSLLKRSYDFYLVYAIASFVIVMLISLVIGLVERADKIEEFKNKMSESAYNVSLSFDNIISSQIENLNRLSQWFVQIGNPELGFSLSREQACVILQENIASEADMKSIYMVWEPNMFDGKDSMYANKEFHDTTGRFVPKFEKHSDGVVERSYITNYNDNTDVNSYYYFKTKKKTFIQEPRILRESARNLLIMPVVYPLSFGTKLLGVVGADYVINNLNQKLGSVARPEGCQLVIFSSTGKVAVSPDKTLLIGRGADAVFDGNIDSYYISFRRGEDMNCYTDSEFIMIKTCMLSGVDTHFSVCLLCGKDALNKDGNHQLLWALLAGLMTYMLLVLMIMFFRWYYTSQVVALTAKGDDMANVEKEYSRHSNLYVPELRKLDDVLYKYHKTFVKIKELNREIESYRYDEVLNTLPANNKFQMSYNNMLATLRRIAQSESERKNKEETEYWISQGIAAINESMRIGSNKVDILSQNILMTLVMYTKAVLGGIYIYTKDDTGEYLTLNAAVALNQKKAIKIKIEKGVGLVGTCALEKQPIFLNKLPDDYVNVFSGLGKSKPRMLAVLPMLYDGELVAIIEIAFITELKPHEKEFLSVISPTIASSLVTAHINEQTEQLMKQFRTQADTLAQNEKLMSENIEQLKIEQQKSANRELEMKGLIDAINNSLLTVEFSTDGILLAANDRFLKIMHYDLAEVQGVNIYDLSPEARADIDAMLTQVTQGKYFEKEMKRVTKSGETKWLWCMYTPYYDSTGNISKIMFFASDISENKRKQEQLEESINDYEKRLHKMRIEIATLRNEKKSD